LNRRIQKKQLVLNVQKKVRSSLKLGRWTIPIAKKWQSEEIDIVVELYSKGLSCLKILPFLPGRTANAIQEKIKYLIF
jgi:hypothetical protein